MKSPCPAPERGIPEFFPNGRHLTSDATQTIESQDSERVRVFAPPTRRYTLSLVTEEPARRYETVEVHRTGAAAKIVLNRPERMNAWSTGMSRDLLEVLRDLADDDGVRGVMLTGAGRAFCTGAD